jgi:2-amino-4-hydroxy-6-hydroxymethyldihydropteridine diphosphokinase
VRSVIVGVGTNLGAREASIRCVRDLLSARAGIAVVEMSTIYETPPLGPPQPDYLNAAFRLKTSLGAPELLQVLLRTERRLGRTRHADLRWGARSIDLDLLWDEAGPHDSSSLQVPHPELEKRAFALAPLLDVAPELRPRLDASLRALGGPPRVWRRAAMVRVRESEGSIDVEVDAQSLVDGCALAASSATSPGRPWSTYHRSDLSGPEDFAAALRELLRAGFAVQRVTISDAAESGWSTQFHGVNLGKRMNADVRLWTTSGVDRDLRTHLSITQRDPR